MLLSFLSVLFLGRAFGARVFVSCVLGLNYQLYLAAHSPPSLENSAASYTVSMMVWYLALKGIALMMLCILYHILAAAR